jgi:hypothetical protein
MHSGMGSERQIELNDGAEGVIRWAVRNYRKKYGSAYPPVHVLSLSQAAGFCPIAIYYLSEAK